MRKLRRAVFCYLVLWAYAHMTARALVPWILNMRTGRRRAGLITIGADSRVRLAEWALAEFFERPMDFNLILHILAGDKYYERNKRDVAQLESETGRRVTEIWDTDPIFAKYPNLRTLARNKEFEKMWAKMKQKVK